MNITINSISGSIPVGGYLNYRYRKISGGSWSAWFTTTVVPFTFTTSDVSGTNYEIETSIYCNPTTSSTTSYTTGFVCPCNISNLSNVVVSACTYPGNTYSVSFDVTYSCMRNDSNVITSIFDVKIDNNHIVYVNPTAASGTQTIQVTGLAADSLSHTLSVTCTAA